MIQLNKTKFNTKSPRLMWTLIILLFFNYFFLGIKYLNNSTDPQAYDTTAYLGEANLVENHGGIFNFFNLCITGKYKQANQHPLYILALTPFASTNINFFINAKIISYLIGLFLLISVYIITRKMYGDLVASIAALGVILNTIFLEWTTMVASESLLMLFSFLCIYFAIKGFNENRVWIYSGVFAGLAYLSKGTGMFLIPGFLVAAFIVYKFKIFKNKFFYLFFISFIVISSPLFIRNIVVYHDPLFNVNKYIAEYSIEQLNEVKYTVFSPENGTNQWKFENNLLPQEKKDKPSSKALSISHSIKKITSGLGPHIRALLFSFLISMDMDEHGFIISAFICEYPCPL